MGRGRVVQDRPAVALQQLHGALPVGGAGGGSGDEEGEPPEDAGPRAGRAPRS